MEIKINTKSVRSNNQGPSFMVQLDNQEPKELVLVEILHVISDVFLNDVVPSYMKYKSPADWLGITEELMKDNPLDLTGCDPDAVSDAVDELEFNLSKSDEENFHAVKVRSPKNPEPEREVLQGYWCWQDSVDPLRRIPQMYFPVGAEQLTALKEMADNCELIKYNDQGQPLMPKWGG
jgi:hypothetical protein